MSTDINGKRLFDLTDEKIQNYYVGKKYGRIVITRIRKTVAEYKKRNRIEWIAEFVCECGNKGEALLRHIDEGSTLSCGCNRLRKSIYKRKTNEYYINPDGTVSVIASNDHNIVFIVDLYTWIWFSHLSWRIDHFGYMSTDIFGQPFKYHTLLYPLPPKGGYVRDHKNRCKLDNRYSNLRVVPYSTNVINRDKYNVDKSTTGEIGVYKQGNYFIAYLHSDKHNVNLSKAFYTLEEAVIERKKWEQMYHQIEELNLPPLILPNGQLNVFQFPFGWYQDRYNVVWAYLGLRTWPYSTKFNKYINSISSIYRSEI